MSRQLRILVTGFGPFPGAPYNPTMALVRRLTALRRPAFHDVALIGHIFHVTYATVDRELPALIEQHRPHAILSFGLAGRTAHMRIETRARTPASLRSRASMRPSSIDHIHFTCCSRRRPANSPEAVMAAR